MEFQTLNARIVGTQLGLEDHDIMSFFLHLSWGTGGQGLGGYALDGPNPDKADGLSRIGWRRGIDVIRLILETVGVRNWEDLKGQLVRVRIPLNPVVAHHRPPIIGHIIDDRWFDLQEFMDKYQKEGG